MKIQMLSADAVRVPLRRPTRISTRRLDQRDYLLVRARAEDGDEVGLGYAYAGTAGGELLACFMHACFVEACELARSHGGAAAL